MFGRTLEQTGAAVVRSSAAVNQSPPPKIRSWAYCVTSTTMGLLGSKPMIRSAKTAELLRLPRLIGGGGLGLSGPAEQAAAVAGQEQVQDAHRTARVRASLLSSPPITPLLLIILFL